MDKKTPQPILLSMIALVFFGGTFLIPVIFVITATEDPGNTVGLFGEQASVGDHRIKLLVITAVWWAVTAIYAFGFWRRKKWLRPALAVYFVAPFVLVATVSLVRLNFVFFSAFAILSYGFWWYLFRKRSVAVYFGDAE